MTFSKLTEAPSYYNDLEKKDTATILKEINQEDQKVAYAVQRALPSINDLINQIIPLIRQGGRIFYVGSGTSGRIGILDASEIPPTFGTDPNLFIGIIAGGQKAISQAVEYAEDELNTGWNELCNYQINSKDTVIGLSASGTTPFVVDTLKKAHETGILTACITSNPDAPISQVSKITIETIVGPEYITGSSRMKSGTAQKMVLNMISSTLMIRMGRVEGNKMVHMKLTNHKLQQRAINMLTELLDISPKLANELLKKHKTVKTVLKLYHHGNSPSDKETF